MKITSQEKAFLDMLAYAEIGPALLKASDNGYNVVVGGTLFTGYADHPRQYIWLKDKNGNHIKNPKTGAALISSAAGRYQILLKWYKSYKSSLKLPDFSPTSQDAIAMQMIKEQKAIPSINKGDLDKAIELCRNIWASLPGAGYNQPEKKIADLRAAFVKAGGVLAKA